MQYCSLTTQGITSIQFNIHLKTIYLIILMILERQNNCRSSTPQARPQFKHLIDSLTQTINSYQNNNSKTSSVDTCGVRTMEGSLLVQYRIYNPSTRIPQGVGSDFPQEVSHGRSLIIITIYLLFLNSTKSFYFVSLIQQF